MATASESPGGDGPPRDAEEWTDAQWLAWLAEGDDGADTDDARPDPAMGRLARSSGGRVLGNAMLGLSEALYGTRRPEIVVEGEAPGDPHDDDLVVRLDPDSPERSTVTVRRRGSGRRPGSRGSPPPDGTPPAGPGAGGA